MMVKSTMQQTMPILPELMPFPYGMEITLQWAATGCPFGGWGFWGKGEGGQHECQYCEHACTTACERKYLQWNVTQHHVSAAATPVPVPVPVHYKAPVQKVHQVPVQQVPQGELTLLPPSQDLEKTSTPSLKFASTWALKGHMYINLFILQMATFSAVTACIMKGPVRLQWALCHVCGWCPELEEPLQARLS